MVNDLKSVVEVVTESVDVVSKKVTSLLNIIKRNYKILCTFRFHEPDGSSPPTFDLRPPDRELRPHSGGSEGLMWDWGFDTGRDGDGLVSE